MDMKDSIIYAGVRWGNNYLALFDTTINTFQFYQLADSTLFYFL